MSQGPLATWTRIMPLDQAANWCGDPGAHYRLERPHFLTHLTLFRQSWHREIFHGDPPQLFSLGQAQRGRTERCKRAHFFLLRHCGTWRFSTVTEWKTNMILVGLEPTIPGSMVRCLIHWATGPLGYKKAVLGVELRTSDSLGKNRTTRPNSQLMWGSRRPLVSPRAKNTCAGHLWKVGLENDLALAIL